MRGQLVVDSSAAVAVILREHDEPTITLALVAAEGRRISAATFLELGMVLTGRLDAAGVDVATDFLGDSRIDVVPFDRSHAERALDGFRRFGKGRHPAGLNLGDCFTYGLPLGDPILSVGDDFRHTDADVVDLT